MCRGRLAANYCCQSETQVNKTLEVYPSMDALKQFWYSDAYQQAKKLREGLSTVNFIMAIEAD